MTKIQFNERATRIPEMLSNFEKDSCWEEEITNQMEEGIRVTFQADEGIEGTEDTEE